MECVTSLTQEFFGETPVLVGNSSNYHYVSPSIFIKVSRKVFKPNAAVNEVAAARFLHDSGFSVAQPLREATPMRDADGDLRMVTFWERLDVGELDPASIRPTCERWLRTFAVLPAHRVELPVLDLCDYADFVATRLAGVDHALKERILADVEALRDHLPAFEDAGRNVFSHGDVRPDNFVKTPSAVVPVDFEASCLAPPEWDVVQLLRFTGDEEGYLAKNPHLDRGLIHLLTRLRTLSQLSALVMHRRDDAEMKRWVRLLGWS